jgi:hypothetical protein
VSNLTRPHSAPWLDNWRGIGVIVVGMERQGFRLSLKKYGNGAGAWVSSTAT